MQNHCLILAVYLHWPFCLHCRRNCPPRHPLRRLSPAHLALPLRRTPRLTRRAPALSPPRPLALGTLLLVLPRLRRLSLEVCPTPRSPPILSDDLVELRLPQHSPRHRYRGPCQGIFEPRLAGIRGRHGRVPHYRLGSCFRAHGEGLEKKGIVMAKGG